MRNTNEVTDGLAGTGSMDIETIANVTGFELPGACKKVVASAPNACMAALILAPADNDVRYELVAALREKMAAGKYCVASSDVAEKLMGSMWK